MSLTDFVTGWLLSGDRVTIGHYNTITGHTGPQYGPRHVLRLEAGSGVRALHPGGAGSHVPSGQDTHGAVHHGVRGPAARGQGGSDMGQQSITESEVMQHAAKVGRTWGSSPSQS